jgi:hypothetical protein
LTTKRTSFALGTSGVTETSAELALSPQLLTVETR